MRRSSAIVILVLSTVYPATPTRGDDWPQWLGPQRDSTWRETGVISTISKSGLPVRWRVPVSLGYSGPAIVNGRVFVTDYVRRQGKLSNSPSVRSELQGQERVLCFDTRDGKLIWKHAYDCSYRISYPSGPRATPTVHDGRIYVLGAEGHLHCLKTQDGSVVWSKDLQHDYQAKTPIWGFCGHPLIDGQKLICLVGGPGSVAVAFDKDTGRELWRALSAGDAGYSPPTVITAGGTRQLLIWHTESLNSLNPETGAVYWSQPLKPNYGMSIMAPRKSGDLLFASGIGNVGAVLRLSPDKPAADILWRGTRQTGVYCANSTPVIDNGTIYGVGCQQGQLRAVELKTGKRLWESFAPTTGKRRAGHGTAFLVKHQQQYFLFNESGDLIVARLTPAGYEERGRFHVLEPTGEAFGRQVVWSHPAFAERCLFARNDKELVCVSLAEE
ncbi:MAG: PQQ-binding-like beta-propeller repeat protein [Planctomycetaceae bacterium]